MLARNPLNQTSYTLFSGDVPASLMKSPTISNMQKRVASVIISLSCACLRFAQITQTAANAPTVQSRAALPTTTLATSVTPAIVTRISSGKESSTQSLLWVEPRVVVRITSSTVTSLIPVVTTSCPSSVVATIVQSITYEYRESWQDGHVATSWSSKTYSYPETMVLSSTDCSAQVEDYLT
jgi:hypothetical protein